MKTEFPKQGVIAALALPFDQEGLLMEDALRQHLDWLKASGIHGILVLGSTGEFPLLSVDQRKDAMAAVVRLAAPLPVMANITDLRPPVVAELGAFARELGLPAVAIMPPLFYPTSDDDQLAWFEFAADASQLPVLLYNFPELTGKRIPLEVIRRATANIPVMGIKQSGSEFSYHLPLIELARDKGFSVFSGSDIRLPEVFRIGADGCIGGLVNFVPEMMLEQFNRHFKGLEGGDPEQTVERMQEVGRIISQLEFPYNVRAGMLARGFSCGATQLVLNRETRRRMGGLVDEFRTRFAEWGLPPVESLSS